MRIFSSDKDEAISGTPRSDVNDARTANKIEKKGYQLPLDDTDYYDRVSNINVAQSVALSQDKSMISSQNNVGAGIDRGRKPSIGAAIDPQKQTIDQQYNWLVQDNVINEQQELEQSKSKSKSQDGLESALQ